MDPIQPDVLRDDRISDIFYFFEALTTLSTGRTVGRKIGVVQEVLLRWYLEDSYLLRRRMYLEQKLQGASGASHKVEFSWYAIAPIHGLSPGAEIEGTSGLTLGSVDPSSDRVRICGPWGGTGIWLGAGGPTPRSGALRSHLDERHIDLRVVSSEPDVHIDVVDRSRLLASLESKRVGAQRFSSSENLGSGIQTIEKAKQASLVAVDIDIHYNGSVKPLQDPQAQKGTISIVALGNGVHWTAKDRAVLGTYVDYTYLVKDAAIIRYARYIQELMNDGDDFLVYFMDYFQGMTKQDRDEFEVTDQDFEIVEPSREARSLRQVLEEHVRTVNQDQLESGGRT